ncbi:helix-turn-helix transcriptional regulator (plasmid) [Trichlorobacter lovleyi]|uniref:helix-turn-helix domain-containing protein n=1 Tax=Trichlorobacter lovleyi TaxID=313985 RepID=UPI00223FF3B3|nr:helix-turn-helix transcriptional regulator [Trichlorobacter lovleyi]QOX81035.1 helix-turn-helix transcriptional regulator [Trichlorobacter lovleyi]
MQDRKHHTAVTGRTSDCGVRISKGVGQRLKEIREAVGEDGWFGKGRFAKKLGISRKVISQVEGLDLAPTEHLLGQLEYFGFRREWVLSGSGEMCQDIKTAKMIDASSNNPALLDQVILAVDEYLAEWREQLMPIEQKRELILALYFVATEKSSDIDSDNKVPILSIGRISSLFCKQTSQAADHLRGLRVAAGGRVWKRLDEHRELAELITCKAPDLLNEHPWIAQWFRNQDIFLMAAAELSHVPGQDDADRDRGVRKPPAWMNPSVLDQYWLTTGVQLCTKCHPAYGCGHDHGWLVHDTGTCSVCGETGEVVNCRLANLAQKLGIPDEDVWRHLPRLIRKKNLSEVEEKYMAFASLREQDGDIASP